MGDTGVTGTVTTIYNQGFEFRINEQIWFMNWYFDGLDYDCSKTCVGFAHDSLGKHWARVQGVHETAVSNTKYTSIDYENSPAFQEQHKRDIRHLIEINDSAKGVWTVRDYPEHERYTHKEMVYRAGAVTVPVSYEER